MSFKVTSEWYLEQVNRVVDHIVTHLDQPLRLRDVSRFTTISPFHFHRVFQTLIGETPAEFSRRLRLEKAIRLMAYARRRSLTDVAFDCGFNSSSDFSRSFKKQYGSSPRSFDSRGWLATHGERLAETMASTSSHVGRLPPQANPDAFKVTIREIPQRNVAYIRVLRPYQGDRVIRATERLMAWAARHQQDTEQWLGYQWDHPGVTSLDDCHYYVAVEVSDCTPRGEVGRFRFPAMSVAQVIIKGGIDLELRALQ